MYFGGVMYHREQSRRMSMSNGNGNGNGNGAEDDIELEEMRAIARDLSMTEPLTGPTHAQKRISRLDILEETEAIFPHQAIGEVTAAADQGTEEEIQAEKKRMRRISRMLPPADYGHPALYMNEGAQTAEQPPANYAHPALRRNELVQTTEQPPATPTYIDPQEGHSDVARPVAHVPSSNVDEIYELSEAVRNNGHIRSPSGNILSTDEFMARDDRPRLVSERQSNIRRRAVEANERSLRAEIARVMDTYTTYDLRVLVAEEEPDEKAKRWGWKWSCFGRKDEDSDEEVSDAED
ncbi:hypothetical protein CLAFUW4_03284 [Fulvia fulva]|uniref:Uncharacterized protein n=1 Tax=Passalora fulva TaxID=5499 RepID=A0A9Q8LBK2_PASFU|nr:uncharacterized protein CLAFUR5_03265 [Fulvia fulva]KAK4632191.1 hypothetical protein CLAFUR4_03273 [Fulvia fulva]UJO14481.1 hypothetical protein CLAFUR5_03265 [Fulvia fulva]WPV10848.1 hypothetical protein CLAFUW4_03284 [Fulvia fulva]WPV26310.1 hypothetical protein CLAFUW7_03277 [Fulvia fulva]